MGQDAAGMDAKALAFTAYNLGQTIMTHVYGVGDEPVAEGYAERKTEVLREIAEGRLTLHSSPADLTAPFPNMKESLRESAFRNANELMRREREAARLIWDVYDSLASPGS